MQQLKITPSVTERTQTVEDYLRDLGKLEMVSPEEETELAGRIKAARKFAPTRGFKFISCSLHRRCVRALRSIFDRNGSKASIS